GGDVAVPQACHPRGAGRVGESIGGRAVKNPPAPRYDSAEQLAEDLRLWQEGKPITARRAGLTERVVKWAARQPALAALIGVSALAVVAVLISVTTALVLISKSRDDALEARQKALGLAEEKGHLAEERGRLAEEKGRLAEEKGRLAEEKGHLADNLAKALKSEERERKEKEKELLLARSHLLTAQLLRVKAVMGQDPAQ